ncbi:Endonuclease/exonuclease/phosphatase [Zopfochytrium polystomum]|nr:Endonuclease/exonuclease/phosphatase [Zopfochytrium polystomum]
MPKPQACATQRTAPAAATRRRKARETTRSCTTGKSASKLAAGAFVAATAAAAASPPTAFVTAASASSGRFTCVAFNVAGLPAFLQSNGVPGDKATISAEIGRRLSAYNYDVVHVQEGPALAGGVSYLLLRRRGCTRSTRTPTATATSGGVPFGDGLNTLSNFPFVDDARTKWDKCNGVVNDSNDCLTPKGFTFMRVMVDDGVYINFYNLHADAGDADADEDARTSNIQQVIDHINTWCVGDPVIVFGDTNSRYTRAKDNIQQFRYQAGMSDAWVNLIHGGEPTPGTDAIVCSGNPSYNQDCEVVDKLFYRSNGMLQLSTTHFEYVGYKFLQDDGNIMSDHDPILVNMTWSLTNGFRQSSLWGGPHGDWFQDVPQIPVPAKAAKLVFRGGDRVDSVGLVLSNGHSLVHGGSGGDEVTLALGATEYWVSSVLCQGEHNGHTRIFYIKATTSVGRTAPSRVHHQRLRDSGDEVDQLGFVYLPQTQSPALNPDGWFRLASPSDPTKCLDFPLNAAAGTAMEIWDCSGVGVQQFTYRAGQLVNRATGWCLDLSNNVRADGAKVSLWPCNGASAQQWVVRGRRFRRRRDGAGPAGGNKLLRQRPGLEARERRDGGAVDVLRRRADAVGPAERGGAARAVRAGVGRGGRVVVSHCAWTFNWAGRRGPRTVLWGCSGASNQRFTYRNGQIISDYNQMCLDVDRLVYADGAKVQMYPCNGGENQQWVFRADPATGATQIRPKANQSFCLNDYNFGSTNGAVVVLWTCYSDTASGWKVTAA